MRGYKEEGTTTTPFDMCVMNQIDRFNLAMDVIDRVQRLQATSGSARETLKNKLIEHRIYVRSHGEDMPEIRDWQWTPAEGPTVVTRTRIAPPPRRSRARARGQHGLQQPEARRPR